MNTRRFRIEPPTGDRIGLAVLAVIAAVIISFWLLVVPFSPVSENQRDINRNHERLAALETQVAAK